MPFNCYQNNKLNIGEMRYQNIRYDSNTIGLNFWQGASHNRLFRSEIGSEMIENRAKRIIQKKVFISHRHSDKQEAIDFKNYLASNNIDYWLDLCDHRLDNAQNLSPIAIANIIEIALINCTHVVAIITPNSKGSLWIPYEYGRIKDPKKIAGNVCAFDQLPPHLQLPEYMQIEKNHRNEVDILDWIKRTPI